MSQASQATDFFKNQLEHATQLGLRMYTTKDAHTHIPRRLYSLKEWTERTNVEGGLSRTARDNGLVSYTIQGETSIIRPRNSTAPYYYTLSVLFDLLCRSKYRMTEMYALVRGVVDKFGVESNLFQIRRPDKSRKLSISKRRRNAAVAAELIFQSGANRKSEKKEMVLTLLERFFKCKSVGGLPAQTIFHDLVYRYQSGNLVKKIESDVLQELKDQCRSLPKQCLIYHGMPKGRSECWDFLMHMFNPKSVAQNWVSPFPKKFGSNDHDWPDIFYSIESIKMESRERYGMIDSRFKHFTVDPNESDQAELLRNKESGNLKEQEKNILDSLRNAGTSGVFSDIKMGEPITLLRGIVPTDHESESDSSDQDDMEQENTQITAMEIDSSAPTAIDQEEDWKRFNPANEEAPQKRKIGRPRKQPSVPMAPTRRTWTQEENIAFKDAMGSTIDMKGKERHAKIDELLRLKNIVCTIEQIQSKIKNLSTKQTRQEKSQSARQAAPKQKKKKNKKTTPVITPVTLNNGSRRPSTITPAITPTPVQRPQVSQISTGGSQIPNSVPKSRKRKNDTASSSKNKKARLLRKPTKGVGYVRTVESYYEILYKWLLDDSIDYPMGQIAVTPERYEELLLEPDFFGNNCTTRRYTLSEYGALPTEATNETDNFVIYNEEKREYILKGADVSTAEFLLGGDATSLFKNPSNPLKENFTHFSIKNMRAKPHKLHKDLNHRLIGVFEGKDKLIYLLQMLVDLVPVLAKHENDGMVFKGRLFTIKYHFIGDLVFLLQILGLKGTGSQWWCPRCLINGTNKWSENGAKRDIHQEVEDLSDGNKSNGRHSYPVFSSWPSSRYHFCSLHAYLAAARSVLKIMISKIIRSQFSLNGEEVGYIEKLEKVEQLFDIHGHNLTEVDMDHTDLINNLCREYDLAKDEMNLQAKIEVIVAWYKGLKRGVMNLDFDMDENSELFKFQEKLRDTGINVNIQQILVLNQSLSLTGDHADLLFVSIQEFRYLAHLSESEIRILKELGQILKISQRKSPEKKKYTDLESHETISGVDLFIKYGNRVVTEFVDTFKIHPFHYCHILATHMIDDMRIFRSLSLFNCSSIERIGAVLKEILRKETNRQQAVGRVHYMLQGVRRFDLKEEAKRLLCKRP